MMIHKYDSDEIMVVCDSIDECESYPGDCCHRMPHIKDLEESCHTEHCDYVDREVSCITMTKPFTDIDDAFDDLLDDLGIEKEKKVKKKNKKSKMKWETVKVGKSGGNDDYWTTADDVWSI